MSVDVGHTLRNITSLGRTHDELSDEIVGEITDSIKGEYGKIYDQGDNKAMEQICALQGYGMWDPKKQICHFTQASCERESAENMRKAHAKCELKRANLKQRCRDGEEAACDEYEDEYMRAKNTIDMITGDKNQDIGCPTFADEGYYEWLGGKCVRSAASWREFCESRGLTYQQDESGMGRCVTNESYCDRKGISWREPEEGQIGDCYRTMTQWVAEAVLGTTVTRVINLGMDYVEQGLASITNERFAGGLATALNPLKSPYSPINFVAGLYSDPEAQVEAMIMVAEDLVLGGAEFVEDLYTGVYEGLDQMGLLPGPVKEALGVIGSVAEEVWDRLGPVREVLGELGGEMRHLAVAAAGTFSDMLHGDFSMNRVSDYLRERGGVIGGAVADTMDFVRDQVRQLPFYDEMCALKERAIEALKETWSEIKEQLGPLGDVLAELVDIAMPLLKKQLEHLKKTWEILKARIQVLIRGIKFLITTIKQVWDRIKQIANVLGDLIEGAVDLVEDVGGGAISFVAGL